MKLALFILAIIAMVAIVVVAEPLQLDVPFLDTWTVKTFRVKDGQGNLIPNARNFEFVIGHPTTNLLTTPIHFTSNTQGSIFKTNSTKPHSCAAFDLYTEQQRTKIDVVFDKGSLTIYPETTRDTSRQILSYGQALVIKCDNVWIDFNEKIGQSVHFIWETTVHGFAGDKDLRQTFRALPVDDSKDNQSQDYGCENDDGKVHCEYPFLDSWTVKTFPRYDAAYNLVPNTRDFELIMGNDYASSIIWIDFNELAKKDTLFNYDPSKPRKCSATDLLNGELTDIRVIYDNYFFRVVPAPAPVTPNRVFREHAIIKITCENLWFDYEQANMVGAEVPFILKSTVRGYSWDTFYRQTFIAEPVDDNNQPQLSRPRTSASNPLVRLSLP